MNSGMKKTVYTVVAVLAAVGLGAAVINSAAKEKDKQNTDMIRWVDKAALTTLDPSKVSANQDFTGVTSISDGLYRQNKEGNPELALAESVKTNKDDTVYTFKLRPDLKWSNGEPLTAQDFVYGWQRTNNPATAAEYAYLFDGIKNADQIQTGKLKDLSQLGIKALDDRTIEVTLEHPMPALKNVLTMPPFFPQNQKFVEAAGKRYGSEDKYVLASGPYTVAKWSGSSDEYRLEKNKFYYDSEVVKAKQIRVRAVQPGTGYNLFLSNATDYAELSSLQANASKNDRSYINIAGGNTAYIQMNENKIKALKNTNIRRAMSYAIDRKTFTDKVLGGTAIPAETLTPKGLIVDPKTKKDFADEAKVDGAITYDPKLAKELFAKGMREEGLTNLTLELLTDDTDGAKASAQYLQSQLQELDGLTIKIKIVPFKQRITLTDTRDFDLVISLWGADYADPSTFIDLFKTGVSFNAGGWSNPEYDALVERANTTDARDPQKRTQDYAKAEQILAKDMGVIPMYFGSKPALQRTDVKDMVYHPAGATYDFKWVYRQ